MISPQYKLAWLILSALALMACGGDNNSDDSTDDDQEFTSMQLNAASYEDWVYVNLTQATVVELTAEEAPNSTDWHMAFRRSEVKLNGGVSGAGNVAGAVGDAQAEFYDDEGNPIVSVFTNADADIEAKALNASYDASALSYVQDSNQPAIADWYLYNPSDHTISANTDVGYLVRHADGESYSRLFIDEASYEGITLSYVIQAANTDQFAEEEHSLSVSFEEGQTQLCLDLDTNTTVDCSETTVWDLIYEVDTAARAINIWTNGGVYGEGNGAAFGAIDATELTDYTSATIQNGYDFSNHYSQDSSSSIFVASSWYAYNLTEEHKLWPNFRTYLIDLDPSDSESNQYALQISNYYSLGDSGSPEIRFTQLTTE